MRWNTHQHETTNIGINNGSGYAVSRSNSKHYKTRRPKKDQTKTITCNAQHNIPTLISIAPRMLRSHKRMLHQCVIFVGITSVTHTLKSSTQCTPHESTPTTYDNGGAPWQKDSQLPVRTTMSQLGNLQAFSFFSRFLRLSTDRPHLRELQWASMVMVCCKFDKTQRIEIWDMSILLCVILKSRGP